MDENEYLTMTLEEYITQIHIMISHADNNRLRNDLIKELDKAYRQLTHLNNCWSLTYEPAGSV